MKRSKVKKALLAALLAVGGLGLSWAAPPKNLKLWVVVKADGDLTGLTSRDVQEIYLGDKQFQNGNKVEPLVNGDEALNDLFLRRILNKTKAQYKKIWSGKAFIDGLAAPSVLPSSEDILREIDKNPDAIGFIGQKELNGHANLKVVCGIDDSRQ